MKKALAKQILSASRAGHLTSAEIERIILSVAGIEPEEATDKLKVFLRSSAKNIMRLARSRLLSEEIVVNIFEKATGYKS
jgi:hypothetical protein